MRRHPAHHAEADEAKKGNVAVRPAHAGESKHRAVAACRDNEAVQRLLVLGAGPGQLGLLAAARRRDLFVIAVDRDPSAPGFQYADRRAIISVEDEPAIERLADAERIDGVIAPGIDYAVATAARVADRLGLPHPISPESALLATSKLRERERFAQEGVPQPDFEVCTTPQEAVAAAGRVGYPCVLKPTDRHGQRGLTYVEGREGLDDAIDEAFAQSRSGVLLVEELVDGPEVTVNGFSLRGRFHPLTVTDRVLADPPAFGVSLAHVWRSSLDPATVGAAIEAASGAASALGVTEGPTYTQVRVGPEGPRVGELGARLGGGHDAELCRATLGIDLNALALAAALGDEVPERALLPVQRAGGACVKFLVAPPGELREVEGEEEARSIEGVLDVLVYRRPGHVFRELRRGSDRAGAVIALGESREEALERADRAAECIRFDTADVEAIAS
jgi:biotin carboxylase